MVLNELPLAAGKVANVLIVILNFNGLEDTLDCLESLRSQTSNDYVAQVIDNGSLADELDRITARFPEVEVIALPNNLGWAGGNNIGMRLALDRGFNYVCLLNNDTVLEPTVIEELLKAAAVLGRPCLLHPAIAYFADPTRWQVNPQPPPGSNMALQGSTFSEDIVEIDFAYGACLMLPVSVLRSVGLLDERFFLQLEETDYFLRAKVRGIRSYCARRARILHKESVSFGGRITDAKTYYQVRNRLLLAEKHTPNPVGYLHAGRTLMWTLRNQAKESGAEITGWSTFLGWVFSNHSLARAARQGVRDYACRRFGRGSAANMAL